MATALDFHSLPVMASLTTIWCEVALKREKEYLRGKRGGVTHHDVLLSEAET